VTARTLRAAALVAAVLVVAGCSADDADPTATVSASPTATRSAPPTVAPTPEETEGEPAEGEASGDEGGGEAAEPLPGTAADALPTAPPVTLDDVADFGTGVTARVASARAIEAQAHGPGEIAGPALVFEVVFTNDGREAVDLGSVTVNLYGSDGTPGIPMSGDPSDPVSGSVGPGRSASGTYVFAIPTDKRSTVTLEVSYTVDTHVVVFQGNPAEL
jgi:hypothetical protein